VRGEDVSILKLMHVAHLEVVRHLVRGEFCDVDDLAPWIDFHYLARPLFGNESVAIGEALAPENLRTFADVVPDGLVLGVDLHHAGRFPAVAIDNIAIGQHLEHDGDAARFEFPHDPAFLVELYKAIGAIAILEEHQPMLHRNIGR
jgi:hypothetical protein